jgi:hypothetical protein
MEHLFSPCTHLYDLLVLRQGRHEGFRGPRKVLQELNLDVTTEELLSAKRAFTYADLYAMMGNGKTVAWLTPHASVVVFSWVHSWVQLDESWRFSFSADGKIIYALARSFEHLLEICDVVLRLLAASDVHSVILQRWSCPGNVSINAPTPTSVAYLLEQCQSLKVLTLQDLEIDEDHCRVLGAYSRPDLKIVLTDCTITGAGASALAAVLGRDQGPTKLNFCEIDNFVLVDGLRGNSRLKSLSPRFSSNRDVIAIAGALRENKGLVELNLIHGFTISNEVWDAVCDSLKTHPTLQVLKLWRSMRPLGADPFTPLAPAVLTSRIQTLVDMLKVNISIHTIRLSDCYCEHELFQRSVIPLLETNRLRPRVRAIQQLRPIVYRAKVLGRALLAAHPDPNKFWMLLSANLDAVFPSTTATTTPAVSLVPPSPLPSTTPV